MQDPITMTLGELVRRIRSDAGFSQEQVAERAGLSPRTVSNIETGAASSPRATTLSLLSEALGLDADEKQRLFAVAKPRRRSLSALGAEPLAKLLDPFGQPIKFDAVERLFARGTPRATMYLIVSGAQDLVESGVDLVRGSLVGEIAILSPQAKRTQSVIAACDVCLLELCADDIPAVHRRCPEFGAHLLRLGACRVYPTRDDGRLAAKPQTRRVDEVDPLVTSRLLENIARLQAPSDVLELMQSPPKNVPLIDDANDVAAPVNELRREFVPLRKWWWGDAARSSRKGRFTGKEDCVMPSGGTNSDHSATVPSARQAAQTSGLGLKLAEAIDLQGFRHEASG
jgi:transcriptional regulator with XRE-family HTH domain